MGGGYPFDPSLSANIPACLKNTDQWLVWKSQPRIGLQNKLNKIPYNFRTNLRSSHLSTVPGQLLTKLVKPLVTMASALPSMILLACY